VPHPTGLAYTFAFVMVAVSLYCVAWLFVATRRSLQNHVDVNVSHVAMGLAMAGMLVPRLNLLPEGLWEGVFVAIALWFSFQGVGFVRGKVGTHDTTTTHGLSHYLIHLVMAMAMLYMYFAPVPGGRSGSPGMSMVGPTGAAADFVGLPLLFVMILFASAVWQLDGLSRYVPSRRALVGVDARAESGPADTRGSWETDEASPADTTPTGSGPTPGASLAPRLEMGCHIAMCITMGYMLILLF
jgi:hypothetical protein